MPGVRADDAPALAALAFGLVESVILRRRDEPGPRRARAALRVADAVQRLLGVPDADLDAVRAAGAALLASLPTPPSAPSVPGTDRHGPASGTADRPSAAAQI